jgi:N6-adenosine-specific RNA methylase IME4
VRRTVDEALDAGKEPTKAKVHSAIEKVNKKKKAKRRRKYPAPSEPEPLHDIDLRRLEVAWEAACESAREELRRQIKPLAQQEKAERRATRERDLAAKITALPTKKYGAILADPPWSFAVWSEETGMDRAADNHYPTQPIEDICKLDVASIAASDCVLFLWATAPNLIDALDAMKAWGFTYKSHYVWGKDKIGLGYWMREQHELLLIGTRGDIPCPAPGQQRASLVMASRGKHSAKPERFAEMIEAYFPTLPKIELNRRGPPRPGWDAWGAEAEIEPQSDPNHSIGRERESVSVKPARSSILDPRDPGPIPDFLRREP